MYTVEYSQMEHEVFILMSDTGAKTIDDHKQQSRHFFEWLFAQDVDFVEWIIWIDRKFFVLHKKPQRKNDGKE